MKKEKSVNIRKFPKGSQKRIESTKGVDLLMGEARFIGPKVLEVRLSNGETQQLTANAFFINAGDRPSRSAIDGLDSVPTLDSTSIMELDSVPAHLLVLGGGYVGLEFGQMFRRFGSAVTIIQRGAHLLAREDDDVAEEVARSMQEDGIEVLLEANPLHVERTSQGTIQLGLKTPAG